MLSVSELKKLREIEKFSQKKCSKQKLTSSTCIHALFEAQEIVCISVAPSVFEFNASAFRWIITVNMEKLIERHCVKEID